MSKWSKVSKIALSRCSLNVFAVVFVIVFLFVIVFVVVFFVDQVMFSHDSHQFCEVSVWSGRL